MIFLKSDSPIHILKTAITFYYLRFSIEIFPTVRCLCVVLLTSENLKNGYHPSFPCTLKLETTIIGNYETGNKVL